MSGLKCQQNKTLHIFKHKVHCKINTLSNTGRHEVPYVLCTSQYGHTTHIKTGTDKHFNGDILSTLAILWDNSFTFCIFSGQKTVSFTRSQRKIPEQSNHENEGTKGWVPSSYPMARKLPIQKGTSKAVHHLTVKLFPQEHDAKQCSPSKPEMCHQSPQVLQARKYE